MQSIKLFTDGSVNPQLKVGFGAYLVVENACCVKMLQDKIQIKRFENTSSTALELETLLWALEEINPVNKKISVYTDCQNILGLKTRCEKFEKNGYVTRGNKPISHHKLYEAFYK
ncbi:MAG: ribonuclease H, partial [Deltaproteobacteria bacterium HGW-Deltaproteobacteria-24]